ncbi:MAG: DUF3572 domain-containing protein [Alphaproteobacteria bacterium]
MTPEHAQTVALQALAFIAMDEDALNGLLNLTGLDIGTLRLRANDPELQAGVLDYLLQHEPRLLAFCEHIDVKPDTPAKARALLPGADFPHYT